MFVHLFFVLHGLRADGLIGPGSFLEVTKILPLLTQSDPSAPSFHVVAYSLPGFGFSEGAKRKGFGVAKMAEVSPISGDDMLPHIESGFSGRP